VHQQLKFCNERRNLKAGPHEPCSRPVFTVADFVSREHGPYPWTVCMSRVIAMLNTVFWVPFCKENARI